MASGWNGSGSVERTDGTRTGSTVWQDANAAGVNIVDTDHDLHDQGLADSIERCWNLDGENSPSANLPAGGFKITGLGNATAATDAMNVVTLQNNGFMQGTTSGSSTAYTLTLAPAITSYVDGMVFWVKFNATNGALPTLDINGLGAHSIKGEDGVSIPPSELIGNRYRPVLYDNSGPQFRVLDSGVAVKPGSIADFAGTVAPDGWLLCDGSAISRTDYVRLFNETNTTYGGGDGSTTFNVPDARGRVSAGKDNMGGTAANRMVGTISGVNGTILGEVGGTEGVTLTVAQMPEHNHLAGVGGTNIEMLASSGQAGATTTAIIDNGTAVADGFNHEEVGGDAEHNNTQPTIIFNKIIKA